MFFWEKRIRQSKKTRLFPAVLLLLCMLCAGCTSLVNGSLDMEYLSEDEQKGLETRGRLQFEIITDNIVINNAESYLSEYPDAFYIPEKYSNRAEHFISFELVDFLCGNTFLYLYQTLVYEERTATPTPVPISPEAGGTGEKYVFDLGQRMEEVRRVSDKMVTVLAMYNYQDQKSYRELASWESEKTETGTAFLQAVYGQDGAGASELKGYALYYDGNIRIYDAGDVLSLANGSKTTITPAISYDFGSEYETKLSEALGTERSDPAKYQNDIVNVSFFYNPGQAAEAILQLQSVKIISGTEEDEDKIKDLTNATIEDEEGDGEELDEEALASEIGLQNYQIRLRFYKFKETFSFVAENDYTMKKNYFWYGRYYYIPSLRHTGTWDAADANLLTWGQVCAYAPDSIKEPYAVGSYSNGAFQANQVKLVSTGNTASFYKTASTRGLITGIPLFLRIDWDGFSRSYRVSGDLRLTKVTYVNLVRHLYRWEEEQYYASEEDEKNGTLSVRRVQRYYSEYGYTLKSKEFTLSNCIAVGIDISPLSESVAFGSYVSNDRLVMAYNGIREGIYYGEWNSYQVTENTWDKIGDDAYSNEYLLCRMLLCDVFSDMSYIANPFANMVSLEGEKKKTVWDTGIVGIESLFSAGELYECVFLERGVFLFSPERTGFDRDYGSFLFSEGQNFLSAVANGDVVLDYGRLDVANNYKSSVFRKFGIRKLKEVMLEDGSLAANCWTVCTPTEGLIIVGEYGTLSEPFIPVFQKNALYMEKGTGEAESTYFQQLTRLEQGVVAYAVFENGEEDKEKYPYFLVGFDNQDGVYGAYDIARAKVIPFAMLDCGKANEGFPEIQTDYGENCIYYLKDCYDKSEYEDGVKQKSGYYIK